MNEHKNDSVGESLGGVSTRALRARRRRLPARVPDLQGYVAGSLVEQSRRCGKASCRCATGDLHGPYVYFVGQAAGRRADLRARGVGGGRESGG